MKKTIIILFTISILLNHSYSQEIHTKKTDSLLLSVQVTNFLKNNEYFTKTDPGYTLFGNQLEPEIQFFSNKKFKFSYGYRMISYYGRRDTLIGAQYIKTELTFSDKFKITLGNTNLSRQNLLPRLFYSPENEYTLLPENGILINYSGNYLKFYTFVLWEKFIFKGDKFQEQIFGGTGLTFSTNRNKALFVSIPMHFAIYHYGGQIDNTNLGVDNYIDTQIGLNLFYKKRENEFSLKFHYTNNYSDNFNGNSKDIALNFKNNNFFANCGYYMGLNVFHMKSENIFYSESSLFPNSSPEVKLLFINTKYEFEPINRIYFKLGFELFYDLESSIINYNYLFNVTFKFSKKIRPKISL